MTEEPKKKKDFLSRLPPYRKLVWLPTYKELPMSPFGVPYAGFNLRMIAATVDTMLLLIFIAPLGEWLVTAYYGPFAPDMAALQTMLQSARPTFTGQMGALLQFLQQSGYFQRLNLAIFLQFSALAVYALFFWKRYSATPGKMLVRLRIVDARTGAPITAAQGWKRIAGYALSCFFLLGFFAIALHKQHRGWHDRIAGTAVIALPWRKKKAEVTENPDPAASEQARKPDQ